MNRAILAAAGMLAGCVVVPPGPAGPEPATPSPGPTAAASPVPAATAWPVPAATPAPGATYPLPGMPGPGGVRWATARPTFVSMTPRAPAAGEQATIELAGLLAGAEVEVWRTGMVFGGFKAGPMHPRQFQGAVMLGVARADAAGRLRYGFTVPGGEPRLDFHGLWLVWPPGDVVAPLVHGWQATCPTLLEGQVFDEAGRPVDGGTIMVRLHAAPTGAGGTPFFERSAAIGAGRYALPDVPMPSWGELVLTRSGWPERRRTFAEHDIGRFWARRESAFVLGSTEEQAAGRRHQCEPLTFDFGGPGSPLDPDAPTFFFSAKAADPAFTTTPIAGRVYDETGALVADVEGAVVVASVQVPGQAPFTAKAAVVGGAYRFEAVPTGEHVSLALQQPPRCSAIASRFVRLQPIGVSGHEARLDFGGPASDADPEAPAFPYKRPDPRVPDPCVGMPGAPAPPP